MKEAYLPNIVEDICLERSSKLPVYENFSSFWLPVTRLTEGLLYYTIA